MSRKVQLEELKEYFDDEIENETRAVNMLLRLKNEIQTQGEILNDKIMRDIDIDIDFHDRELKTARNRRFIVNNILFADFKH
jgi:hypothetical protein